MRVYRNRRIALVGKACSILSRIGSRYPVSMCCSLCRSWNLCKRCRVVSVVCFDSLLVRGRNKALVAEAGNDDTPGHVDRRKVLVWPVLWAGTVVHERGGLLLPLGMVGISSMRHDW